MMHTHKKLFLCLAFIAALSQNIFAQEADGTQERNVPTDRNALTATDINAIVDAITKRDARNMAINGQSNFPARAVEGTVAIPLPSRTPVIPFVDLSVRTPETGSEVAFSVQLLLLLTVLSLAPSILVLMTSFLRISIVLDFIKRALSLQQVPPNSVLMGIAFFMTVFIMWPTLNTVYTNSVRPLTSGEISVTESYHEAEAPVREFMYKQMRTKPENIELFMSMRGLPKPDSLADVPTYVLIPAFILNELTVAFKMGILLYIPFIIIDMVVASALMSMGMIMLPPVMISMPFKLILFILVDGWGLLTGQLMRSFV
jgi:flagellar biosynthetic protein FliP